MNYINCNLHHLFMKVVYTKIHVNFIIILAIFQKFTPMQQGNPLIKNYLFHVEIQLSMAYFQSVMLELLSRTVFPRISEVDHLFIVSVRSLFLLLSALAFWLGLGIWLLGGSRRGPFVVILHVGRVAGLLEVPPCREERTGHE